ncbi:testis-expressed protein 19.2-like [Trichechus inunguis]
MCPPVKMPYLREGMSYLHESWMYQLQHGPQLQVCFECFKDAFLELRELLELEDWGAEDWDSEPMEFTEEGPEQWGDPGVGPSWGQGQGQLAEGGSGDGGPGAPVPAQEGSEGLGLHLHFVPTELLPQDAVPLALGPEDANWTQGLPWKLEIPPVCPHWPSLPPLWQGSLKADLPPGEPMVLELGCAQALDPAKAEAWLLDLQVIAMVGCFDAIYLRKMAPYRALRTPSQGWKLLLEPKELWLVRLQDALQQQDLHRWKLSILESSFAGQNEELVPADMALLKQGFTILSYSPLANREPEQGDSASRPTSSTQGQEPSTTETWGSVPGEKLAAAGVSTLEELPCVQPLSPGPQN